MQKSWRLSSWGEIAEMPAGHIAFRTDASSQIGTGHFMRCLTLADGLIRRGAKIRFVSRGLPVHLCNMLEQRSIDLTSLPITTEDKTAGDLQHSHWLNCSQEQDAQATQEALSDRHWDWLIVDHYALDARWEGKLRGRARHIMVIDDLADRQHDCDMLLDQNIYIEMQTRYSGMVPSGCALLLGPRYALLREEFRTLRKCTRPRSGPVRNILVFFGGVDADNCTGQVIALLSEANLPGIRVDVVIGAQHPHAEQIKDACAVLGYGCHVQTNRMAELMAASDLAIGAGGGSTWERCCLGLPSLVFCTADNQRQQLADAARCGLLYLPDTNVGLKLGIQNHLLALMENGPLRECLSRNSMELVNGLGAERVIARLGINDIDIRQADVNDANALFQWRNHPSIRDVSQDQSEIEWHTHLRWLDAVLADSDRFLLIGHRGQTPLGVVRFDKVGDTAELSIYAVPGIAERGVGQHLLHSAEMWLAENHPDILKIRAQVLSNNSRSHKMFFFAGYEIESTFYLKKVQHP